MGMIPPKISLTLREQDVLRQRFVAIYHGPAPRAMILQAPVNCRGCGANYVAFSCPYCGRHPTQ